MADESWGSRNDSYVQRSTVMSIVPDCKEWAQKFIRDMPWFGFRDSRYHWYGEDFYLDIAEIEKLSTFRYRIPTNSEFAAMVHGLPPDKVKELADEMANSHRQALLAYKAEEVLEKLDENPVETVSQLNDALCALVVRPGDDQYEDFHFPSFRIINADRYIRSIREISLDENEDKLLQIKGWLTYVQDSPKERITLAKWACLKCGEEEKAPEEPTYCTNCQKTSRFSIREKETEKFQECILTENFEDSSGFPTSLEIIVSGDHTGLFSPGDRVVVVGILESIEEKTKNGTILFKHVVEAISVRKEDEKAIVLSDEDRKAIEQFRQGGNLLNRLADLYAPQIVGYEHIKRALVLQAAGAPDEVTGSTRKRGQIHILLMGDPGLGKSQLLKANSSISRKSLYVSDASAAGLTAAVSDVNGRKVMQAGVLVLADEGTACIDELDKMKREDREGIHTALEQGFISKSKAGLHAHFKSRTSVLAAANPKYGRFDASKSIADQVTIEVPLLNRFDLIFLFMDQSGSAAYEADKAMRMLSSGKVSTGYDPDFLLKYMSLASDIRPVLTDDVRGSIAEYYAATRKKQRDTSINPRTLEAIGRLTMASARVRMSPVTQAEDFENAKELVELYLKQFDYDPDAISGLTKSVRDVINWARGLLGMHGIMHKDDLIASARQQNIDTRNVEKALDAMYKSGDIYDAGHGRYGVV